jgi:hypothetical protein
MFNEFVKGKIMKKKMYKQPTTEVLSVNSEYLMTGISVSPGTPSSTTDPPEVHMPGRRGDMIP